jgi:hypothetical protein
MLILTQQKGLVKSKKEILGKVQKFTFNFTGDAGQNANNAD